MWKIRLGCYSIGNTKDPTKGLHHQKPNQMYLMLFDYTIKIPCNREQEIKVRR